LDQPKEGDLIMRTKISLLVGSVLVALAAGSVPPIVDSALAACSPNDPVNGTTATDAMRAMESAGFTQVQVYEKGCDSAWHAHAIQNGMPVNVVWNSEGQVVTEGDLYPAQTAYPATRDTYPFSPEYPATTVYTTTYTPLVVNQAQAGYVVTTPTGQTVYTFDQDVPGRSNCYGDCISYWQPVFAPPGAVPTGSYTVITRSDGRTQWATSNGMPLYTYVYDRGPSDITGNNQQNVWHADYITDSGMQTVTQDAPVTVQPGTNTRIVSVVNAGTKVVVLSNNGNWTHIQAPGIDGYIPSGALR
jgi:predicted lipoprotein with Yx(FWY)xxD motif